MKGRTTKIDKEKDKVEKEFINNIHIIYDVGTSTTFNSY